MNDVLNIVSNRLIVSNTRPFIHLDEIELSIMNEMVIDTQDVPDVFKSFCGEGLASHVFNDFKRDIEAEISLRN